ncbi:hypothetical protein [Pseudomonas aeruginosa]|jgi:hypothetical protein|uniref:hypothetical protein n=1 Tax=Pseudomonas aeruginosa TaxID=287 RepID=UPI0009A2821A|nr:hypothetical protein [Pseudomonas aeruginosa]MBG5794182.1 hypothetical protein [Pseudomonas aeruginosa]MBG6382384.1 hypothetical protein [Pseudomonas aeruginosa]MBH4512735.1 hypothetical protein [Pseudomonas aeruginosa]MCO2604240.1 hypothetical protein [Pseudomonas aeruginosa]MCS9148326.1 hypothetical protein [Pseudomonas aeruginosa]
MTLSRARPNLEGFITQEQVFFQSLPISTPWASPVWGVGSWLPQRNNQHALTFETHRQALEKTGYPAPPKGPLPCNFQDFSKALIVYLQRIRNLKFSMVAAYNIAVRRLYNPLFERCVSDPTQLTRGDFDRVVGFLRESGYKNFYDAISHLQVVADTIDSLQITEIAIHFEHDAKPEKRRHDYISLHDPDRAVKQRKSDDILPSREAMEAYALCSNHPLSEGEEILLRVIDLLIATGQRGNEVAVIPYDCWVERPIKGTAGKVVVDANGKPIVECGIRYFAEKQFQSRVHWFAESDVPLARRAVERLKVLTQEQREIARWQEAHPGRLWNYSPQTAMSEVEVLDWLGFSENRETLRNLSVYFSRNGVHPLDETSHQNKAIKRRYLAGDIERFLVPKLRGHAALTENVGGKLCVVLKTSETLAMAFDGQFRLNGREANVFRAIPRRVTLVDINRALGNDEKYPSIFSRRSLTESDGAPIRLTSHQPRHWRNTIYHLTGMSDVQQALALGRKRLDQNVYYQHTSIEENTAAHQEFLAFNSHHERIDFLHSGIRDKRIQGALTDSYHALLSDKGTTTAEAFLAVHATALHVTPFGGCIHDFSQAPCPKHLQCWNGCSHLHLMGTPSERVNLEKQAENLTTAITIMRDAGAGEAGSDVWLADQEDKLNNLKSVLARDTNAGVQRVFPNGHPMTVADTDKRHSSVSDD